MKMWSPLRHLAWTPAPPQKQPLCYCLLNVADWVPIRSARGQLHRSWCGVTVVLPPSEPGSGGLSQSVCAAPLPFPCPAGPAESLFKESYYQLMKTALKGDGILCCQGEWPWQGSREGPGQGAACLPDADPAHCPQGSASGCTWTSLRRCGSSASRSSP